MRWPKAMSSLHSQLERAATVRAALDAARARGLRALDEPSGKQLLAGFGLRVPKGRVVAGSHDLDALVAELAPPYVLKVVSSDLLHKSDVGGVKVGLQGMDDVGRELERMRTALDAQGVRAERWLVEEMAPDGLEFVIGGVVDPEFGPMVMAGLGGIFIEVLRDVAFRICPIDRADALDMLDELRGATLLRGVRGRRPVDVDAIIDALVRVGGADGMLVVCAADVTEVDINPLLVGESGAVAVDARVILRTDA